MKYYKIVNTQSKPYKEFFVSAKSMDHVEAWVIKNMPDWYFGMNIIEVNPDKTDKLHCDFSCVAVREYFVYEFKTEDDKKILNTIYSQLIKTMKSEKE